MNREQAKELLPIIQAFADGKVIEYEFSGGWRKLEDAYFNDSSENYRIKPEPRVIYVNHYNDGRMYAHENRVDAEESKCEHLGMSLVVAKFIEAED